MISNTNDLRYLLQLKSYSKLPYMHKYLRRDLAYNYSQLVKHFDITNSPIVRAKKQVLVRIIDIILDIVRTSKDVEKIGIASTILRALMIDPNNEDFLWNVDFLETTDQKSMLTHLSIEIKKYNEKVKQQVNRKKQTLEQQIAKIETGLGVHIDSRKCSVLQYLAYSKEYAAKYNLLQRQLN